jgi:hypothetical protein
MDAKQERKARGARLRRAREVRGYRSADAAAEALDISLSTYGGHECGERGYDRHVERYAAAFGVSPEWLLFGRGPGPNASLAASAPSVGIDNRRIETARAAAVADPHVEAAIRELVAGRLSKEAGFRLFVWGEVGAKEFARLIEKLELEARVLFDDEADDRD